MSTAVFDVYVSLWELAQSKGLRVYYDGWFDGLAGAFHHEGMGGMGPEIMIHRPHYIEQERPSEFLNNGQRANVEAELLTLAHEFGHALSHLEKTPRAIWEQYFIAVHKRDALDESAWPAELSGEEKARILEEEILAWNLGAKFIQEGLTEEYARRALSGVNEHRLRMGLPAISQLSLQAVD